MNRALVNKYLLEARWLLLACGLALFLFCWVRVWIVSQLDMSAFETILEQVWDKFEKFSPVPLSQLLTYTGRVALTYVEPVVLLCITVWAVARGSDAVSGELGRGTMEMLLAQPISRLQLLATQGTVTLVGLALLATAAWLGTYVGIQTTVVTEEVSRSIKLPGLPWEIGIPLMGSESIRTPLREKVDATVYIPAAMNLFSLGVCLAGLATFMSSWDRYRWRTIGLVIGIIVVQMMAKLLGVSSETWSWLKACTFFTAYEPEVIVAVAAARPEQAWQLMLADPAGAGRTLGPLGMDLVLLGLGALGYLLAAIIFCRRDLPAPL